MRILIIGYSAIVQKRVLPALKKVKQVEVINIASRGSASRIPPEEACSGRIFNSYEDALSQSRSDVVYISLVNSSHAAWAEQALLTGCHVVVDKPAFTCLEDARRLTALAQTKGLCLAEATVYAWHPQIQAARDLFLQAGTHPTRLTVSFSFPPFSADNFRYQKNLGGGALWDLGPYAVSPGRLFFESEPEEVFCRVGTRNPDTGVDTSFSMLAVYPQGRSMVGQFDFNTEYRNHMHILGPAMSVEIDRVFTTPPDMENVLQVRSQNQTTRVPVAPADCFTAFFHNVFAAIDENRYGIFAEQLLSDASVLNSLRKAAQEDETP